MPCQVEGQVIHDFDLFLVANIKNLVKINQNEGLAKACFRSLQMYLFRIALFAFHNSMYTSSNTRLSGVTQSQDKQQREQQQQVQFVVAELNINKTIVK